MFKIILSSSKENLFFRLLLRALAVRTTWLWNFHPSPWRLPELQLSLFQNKAPRLKQPSEEASLLHFPIPSSISASQFSNSSDLVASLILLRWLLKIVFIGIESYYLLSRSPYPELVDPLIRGIRQTGVSSGKVGSSLCYGINPDWSESIMETPSLYAWGGHMTHFQEKRHKRKTPGNLWTNFCACLKESWLGTRALSPLHALRWCDVRKSHLNLWQSS